MLPNIVRLEESSGFEFYNFGFCAISEFVARNGTTDEDPNAASTMKRALPTFSPKPSFDEEEASDDSTLPETPNESFENSIERPCQESGSSLQLHAKQAFALIKTNQVWKFQKVWIVALFVVGGAILVILLASLAQTGGFRKHRHKPGNEPPLHVTPTISPSLPPTTAPPLGSSGNMTNQPHQVATEAPSSSWTLSSTILPSRSTVYPTKEPKLNPTWRPTTTIKPTSAPVAIQCAYTMQTISNPLPGKKGVGMKLNPKGQQDSWVQNLPKLIALKPSWNYSWGLKRVNEQPENILFVPMIWGGQSTAGELHAELQSLVKAGNAKLIFGFNEPDRESQSNVQVSTAEELWPVLEQTGLPIVSPSCSSPGGAWMQQFMTSAEQNCYRVNYVGIHWYGTPVVESFKSKMQAYYNQYKKPLIITEFAPADWSATTISENKYSRSTVLTFMKEVIPWLEQQDWIAGYSWFNFPASSAVGTCSALFKADGTSLTALGQYYASVSTASPYGNQSIVAWS